MATQPSVGMASYIEPIECEPVDGRKTYRCGRKYSRFHLYALSVPIPNRLARWWILRRRSGKRNCA